MPIDIEKFEAFDADQVLVEGYSVGLMYGLCYNKNVEGIFQFDLDDKMVWQGVATDNTSIHVHRDDLFTSQMPVKTEMDLQFGRTNQVLHDYTSKMGNNVPRFFGIISVLLRRMTMGVNPNVREPSWVVEAIPRDLDPSSIHAEIGEQANPIFVLYDVMTDRVYGAKIDPAKIDIDNFREVAEFCFISGLAFAYEWTDQQSTSDFVAVILNHIDGVLVRNRLTGKYEVLIISRSSNLELPNGLGQAVLDESSIEDLKLETKDWSQTINQLTIVYLDRTEHRKKTVTMHDGPNIFAQKKIVPEQVAQITIPSEVVASRYCARQLAMRGYPLKRVTMRVTRAAFAFNIGQAFKLSWALDDIVEEVFRVGEVDTGTIEDGYITVTAVEDIFTRSDESYIGIGQVLGTPGDVTLQMTDGFVYDMTRYYALKQVGEEAFADAEGQNLGAPAGVAAANLLPNGANNEFGVNLYFDLPPNPLKLISSGKISPAGTVVLSTDSGALTTYPSSAQFSFFVGDPRDWTDLRPGVLILFATGSIGRIVSYDHESTTMSAEFGLLDTVITGTPDGTRFWVLPGTTVLTAQAYPVGSTGTAKATGVASAGNMLPEAATPIPYTVASRWDNPYPNKAVTINGVMSGTTPQGGGPVGFASGLDVINFNTTMTIGWATRDRLTENMDEAALPGWTDPSVPPEAGTTTTVTLFAGATPISTQTTAGTSVTYTGLTPGLHTIEMHTSRGGINSYQTLNYVFAYF